MRSWLTTLHSVLIQLPAPSWAEGRATVLTLHRHTAAVCSPQQIPNNKIKKNAFKI